MTNLYTLEELAAKPDLLTALDLEELDALTETVKRATDTAKAVQSAIQALLQRRYGDKIDAAYRVAQKDAGTVHVLDGGFDLVIDRAKRVSWDEAKLAEIGDKIADAGDDPQQYIERKLSVSEAKFKAWPKYLQDTFAPARELKPGPVSIKIERAKREAA